MSILASFKHMWDQGEEEDYVDDDNLDSDEPQATSNSSKYATNKYSSDKYSSEKYAPAYGGGDGSGTRGRSLRSVPIPLRAREKNIYTLRPKNQDEAAIAADYLKSGSAVVMNLETVDRATALRIIDFMSGVCYGLEGQGHAMKLGDSIFMFTPAEFEISSDELDYGENRDFFFKEVDGSVTPQAKKQAAASAPASAPVNSAPVAAASPANAPQAGGNVTSSGYATADYTPPHTAQMNTPAPGAVASTPVSPTMPPGPSTSVSGAVPIARASTLPASSVYGSGGKAHVLVGGKPAVASTPASSPAVTRPSAPSSAPQSSYQSSERRSWER